MSSSSDLQSKLIVDFDGELPESVDEAAIRRMNAVVRVLDEGMRVPGTDFRVGIDPLLGILPVGGDLAATALSLYVVFESARLGVPRPTLVRMLANLGVDLVGGAVPVIGVLFDAFWKANKYNLALALERLTEEPSEEPVAVDID